MEAEEVVYIRRAIKKIWERLVSFRKIIIRFVKTGNLILSLFNNAVSIGFVIQLGFDKR